MKTGQKISRQKIQDQGWKFLGHVLSFDYNKNPKLQRSVLFIKDNQLLAWDERKQQIHLIITLDGTNFHDSAWNNLIQEVFKSFREEE